MASERSRRAAPRGRAHRPAAPPRPARIAEAPAIDEATGTRAALALGGAALLLFALRTAAAFDPGMRWWGASALRFAAPALGWGPWALAALAFLPAVARPLAARLARFGDALVARAPAALGGLAALAMLLVAVLPDRLWMVGDFLLRLGCTRGQIPVEIVFPQALPLDLFLHHHLPLAVARAHLADPNVWERVLGAVEAGLLALASAELARQLGLRGAAAAACAGLVVFSGALGMFTGYGKAFVDLTLLTVLVAGAALRVVRDGGGPWNLAALLVVAILFHRSALALYAPFAVAAWGWARSRAAHDARRRLPVLSAFAAPLAAALFCMPLLIASMKVTDARHLAPTGASPAAVLAAAFAPAHLAGVLDLVVANAPFALVAPLLAVLLAAPLRARGAPALVLLALALPAVLVLVFVHPRQGLFRDTDVFAPSLAALAVVAAALAGDALRGAPKRAWIAVPVVLVAALTTLQHLSLAADLGRGTRRVRAYLEGPPRPPDEERALLWAYLAERLIGAGRAGDAIPAFEKAAELAPSPRILMEWALAESDRRNYAGARRVYARVIERAPGFTEAWLGLADVSIGAHDWAGARAALDRAEGLEPGRPEIPEMRRALAIAAARDTAR